jgi:hypothetical protein
MGRKQRQRKYSLQPHAGVAQDSEARIIRHVFPMKLIAETPWYQDQLEEGLFAWATLRKKPDSDIISVMASGTYQLGVAQRAIQRLAKWEQRRRDRIASVYLDEDSIKMLKLLGRETSIRWDKLTEMAGLQPSDTLRVVALLANAELCEVGPLRLRLSDAGDLILSGETKQEITWDIYAESNDATPITSEPS